MQPCINEARIRFLEESRIEMDKDIKMLINKIDLLIRVLIKLSYIIIMTGLGAIGYLVSFWVQS